MSHADAAGQLTGHFYARGHSSRQPYLASPTLGQHQQFHISGHWLGAALRNQSVTKSLSSQQSGLVFHHTSQSVLNGRSGPFECTGSSQHFPLCVSELWVLLRAHVSCVQAASAVMSQTVLGLLELLVLTSGSVLNSWVLLWHAWLRLCWAGVAALCVPGGGSAYLRE